MFYDDYYDEDRDAYDEWRFDRERDYTLAYNRAAKMVKENPDLYMEADDYTYEVNVRRKSDNKLIVSISFLLCSKSV